MSGKHRSSISLNCSVAALSGAESPNTPEILNAIINISSDHLETYARSTIKTEPSNNDNEYATNTNTTTAASSCRFDFSGRFPSSSSSSSVYSAHAQCHSLQSPDNSLCHQGASPPGPGVTVKNYHSQFVKEGLKLKVKQKIKDESSSLSNYGSEDGDSKLEGVSNNHFCKLVIIVSISIRISLWRMRSEDTGGGNEIKLQQQNAETRKRRKQQDLSLKERFWKSKMRV